MKKYFPVLLLLILAVSTRLLPHPANFTALGAVALFGGLYLPRKWAVAGPLLVMLISDIFIGFYSPLVMISVYFGFTLMAVIGCEVRKNKKIATVLGGTVVGSLFFFLITNWAVWAFGGLYPPTASGLLTSYYLALPFFKNSLLADIVYITVLAGGYELALAYRRRPVPEKKPNLKNLLF